MNSQPTRRTSVRLVVPSWFWGGKSSGFFVAAGLHQRRAGAETLIQTDESYRHSRPNLVEDIEIAGPPSHRSSSFQVLRDIAERMDMEMQGPDARTVAELDRVKAKAERSGDLVDRFEYWRLATMVLPLGQLPLFVERIYVELIGLPLEGQPLEYPFKHASIHIVRRKAELLHRAKLPAVLLRVRHDDKVRAGNTRHLNELLAARESTFASGEGLLRGQATFDTYIGPLLASLVPRVWGFASYRSFGPIIFSLGSTVSGTRKGPAEMLHLMPHLSRDKITWSAPNLSETAAAGAIHWWCQSLNEFFGVLTDPAIFANAADIYNPAAHHQFLMTAEQLFDRITAMLSLHRDVRAQTALFFTVLDTLERMTGRPIDRLCSESYAQESLNELKDSIPPAAATVLLPIAERGVAALLELQDGFFLDASGTGMTPERAAARYVKLLRNATHGHGTKKRAPLEETNLLLATHSGNIPPDLAMLGYLYLLVILSQPSRLRRHLSGGKVW